MAKVKICGGVETKLGQLGDTVGGNIDCFNSGPFQVI